MLRIKMKNIVSVVESQILKAAAKINLNKNTLNVLAKPMNEIQVNLPHCS